MAKEINQKYVGMHFGLGNGVEIKITESTTPEQVQVLVDYFPDIIIEQSIEKSSVPYEQTTDSYEVNQSDNQIIDDQVSEKTKNSKK